MTTRVPEAYRYHFISPTLKSDRPAPSRPPPSELNHKNAKISFKYLAECQEKEKKMVSPKTDIYRFVLPCDQTSEPLRNQTFSLLGKQHKHLRKTEGIELVSNSALAPKYPLNLPKKTEPSEVSKKGTEYTEEGKLPKSSRLREKENQRELGELRKENARLQQKIQQLTLENELLRVRAEDSKKQLNEQHNIEGKLKKELKDQCLRNDELCKELQQVSIQKKRSDNELEMVKKQLNEILTSKAKLAQISGVFDVSYEPQGDYLLRATKDQSLSTLVQSFQQEYKQIACFLGLQVSLANIQELLMSQLRHLKKQAQVLYRQGIRFAEVEREKSRLSHVLRKNEAELGKLCNQNYFLSNELSKQARLIDQYNQQIEILRLKELQRRIRKYNKY